MFSRRLTAWVAAASMAPLGVVTTSGAGDAAASEAAPARAGHHQYVATIRRTEHGIPHITADGFGSLGFGSGYAAAQTSTCKIGRAHV